MNKHLRKALLALSAMFGSLFAFAYDSKDLVGSALEYEVSRDYFMMHFQDGNILCLAIALIFAAAIFFLRERINLRLKIVFITIAATLFVVPALLMLSGSGYSGAYLSIALLVVVTISLSIFIILPILIIIWIYRLIMTGDLKQSSIAIVDIMLNGAVTIPVSIIIALAVFWGITKLTYQWNLSQCEKYVQSRWEYFTDVPDLMYEWESAHTLQWGGPTYHEAWEAAIPEGIDDEMEMEPDCEEICDTID